MVYSESLASRIRQILRATNTTPVARGTPAAFRANSFVESGAIRDHRGVTEKKMFGGIGFLLHGNMCVGVSHTSLIARLGPEQADAARRLTNVVEFDVAGRPLKGWVMIEAEGVETDEQLTAWIRQAVEFVETLPRK